MFPGVFKTLESTSTWAVALILAVQVVGALWTAPDQVQVVSSSERKEWSATYKHGEHHASNHPNSTDDMAHFLWGCEKISKNNNA